MISALKGITVQWRSSVMVGHPPGDGGSQAAVVMTDSPATYARLSGGGRNWKLQKTFAKCSVKGRAVARARAWRHGREMLAETNQFNVPGALLRYEEDGRKRC